LAILLKEFVGRGHVAPAALDYAAQSPGTLMDAPFGPLLKEPLDLLPKQFRDVRTQLPKLGLGPLRHFEHDDFNWHD
jgi:hypothetical protein